MKKRDALALLRKDAETRLAYETLAGILAAAAEIEESDDRLVSLREQIAGAELTLAAVRERIQREDAEGRARVTEIQRGVEQAEREAAAKVTQYGREANARIDAARQAAKDTLDTLKRATDEEIRLIKAEVETEQQTLTAIRTQLAAARRELAPLMGQAS